MNNFVLANSGMNKDAILGWCVYAGPHLQEEGWLMLFRFPNGLQASVAFTPWTRGIEVGVMNGEWLVDVIEDLSGEDVLQAWDHFDHCLLRWDGLHPDQRLD